MKYSEINGLIVNKNFSIHVERIIRPLQENLMIVVYGKPCSYKSSLIKMAAYLYSIIKGFLLIYYFN